MVVLSLATPGVAKGYYAGLDPFHPPSKNFFCIIKSRRAVIAIPDQVFSVSFSDNASVHIYRSIGIASLQ